MRGEDWRNFNVVMDVVGPAVDTPTILHKAIQQGSATIGIGLQTAMSVMGGGLKRSMQHFISDA
jgi:hypothetical protein